MIDPRAFVDALAANGIGFAAGVPDSLLKEACAAITDLMPPAAHIIAANEGAAVGLAIGHYLASGAPALVYLQNSGLGNAINPLVSLADPAIYSVPMLLLIGWRGEMRGDTQLKDEPQHVTQGRITIAQLDTLGIPCEIIDAATPIDAVVARAAGRARDEARPVALVARKESFAPYPRADSGPTTGLTREAAIAAVIEGLPAAIPIVATTGMASRELFEMRAGRGDSHARDFLTVGGMGHAVSIATGIALRQPRRKILCLDGDGAMLMQLGALTEAALRPNLIHVVINNGAHDSVGGQPTLADRLDLGAIGAACGYGAVARVEDRAGIQRALEAARAATTSQFIEIGCRRGARSDLGRPTRIPIENKRDFMGFLMEGADGA